MNASDGTRQYRSYQLSFRRSQSLKLYARWRRTNGNCSASTSRASFSFQKEGNRGRHTANRAERCNMKPTEKQPTTPAEYRAEIQRLRAELLVQKTRAVHPVGSKLFYVVGPHNRIFKVAS